MNIAIISSLKDKASINIKENLINNFDFNKLEEQFDNNDIFQYKINNKNIKLYTIKSELINAENIEQVMQRGARRVAMISGITSAQDVTQQVRDLRQRMLMFAGTI